MKTQLVIEKSGPADNNINVIYTKTKGMDKADIVRNFQNYLPALKCGYGGSHIWISNQQNERLAVIYIK